MNRSHIDKKRDQMFTMWLTFTLVLSVVLFLYELIMFSIMLSRGVVEREIPVWKSIWGYIAPSVLCFLTSVIALIWLAGEVIAFATACLFLATAIGLAIREGFKLYALERDSWARAGIR